MAIKMCRMVVLKHPQPDWADHLNNDSLLVVTDLRQNRTLWQSVRQHSHTRVTFDLYDVGIAIFNPKLNKQHYIINW